MAAENFNISSLHSTKEGMILNENDKITNIRKTEIRQTNSPQPQELPRGHHSQSSIERQNSCSTVFTRNSVHSLPVNVEKNWTVTHDLEKAHRLMPDKASHRNSKFSVDSVDKKQSVDSEFVKSDGSNINESNIGNSNCDADLKRRKTTSYEMDQSQSVPKKFPNRPQSVNDGGTICEYSEQGNLVPQCSSSTVISSPMKSSEHIHGTFTSQADTRFNVISDLMLKEEPNHHDNVTFSSKKGEATLPQSGNYHHISENTDMEARVDDKFYSDTHLIQGETTNDRGKKDKMNADITDVNKTQRQSVKRGQGEAMSDSSQITVAKFLNEKKGVRKTRQNYERVNYILKINLGQESSRTKNTTAEPENVVDEEKYDECCNKYKDIGNGEIGDNGFQANKKQEAVNKKQKLSYVCCVCFRKFPYSTGIKKHIYYKHSKAFCALAHKETVNTAEELQLVLFCPKNCKFVTLQSDSFFQHIAKCEKPEMKAEIQGNDVPQFYDELQGNAAPKAIIDMIIRKKSDVGRKRRKQNALKATPASLNETDYNVLEGNDDDVTSDAFNEESKHYQQVTGMAVTPACQADVKVEGDLNDIYPCDLCDFIFSSSIFLENHVKSQHSEDHKKTKANKRQCVNLNQQKTFTEVSKKPTGENPLACYECGRSFKRKCDLQRHTRTHTGEKPFVCSQCGKRFRDRSNLYKHSRIHTGEESFKCEKCGNHFRSNHHLKMHMRTCMDQKPFKCKECNRSFTEGRHLSAHMRTHSGEKPFKCNECGKGFLKSHQLHQHFRIHTGEKPYRCNECGKNFRLSSSFHLHIKTHTGEKPFKCNECGKGFIRGTQLRLHMRAHTGEKPFKCDDCGKSFSLSRSLDMHMRIHTGEKPYKCKVCNKAFRINSHLPRHMRTHTGEKPFQCNECGKRFSHDTVLYAHMRIHTGEKPFRCNECGKNFRQRTELSVHMRKHTGERPVQCSICGKRLSSSDVLHRHMRIHTGEKPFKCNVCDTHFRDIRDLNRHRRIHTGEKPFQCSECGKSFRENSQLNRHIRTHTGEKPYRCDECGKGFGSSGQRQAHMRGHRGEKPYRCDICNKSFGYSSHLTRHRKIHAREEILQCKYLESKPQIAFIL